MANGHSARVMKLTRASTIRRFRSIAAALCAIVWIPSTAAESAETWQDIASIASAAERHVFEVAGRTHDKLSVSAGFLDPRLKLARCPQSLEPFLRPGTRLGGRVVVGVRCPTRSWKVYLPVHVGIMKQVVVTARPLARREAIGPDDVTLAERDVSRLSGSYMPATAEVLGKFLTRSVGHSVVLQPSMLEDETLVRKGQAVTISVNTSAINIQATGVAVSSGSADELVRVRNLGSGKIVEGRVRSARLVEVASE